MLAPYLLDFTMHGGRIIWPVTATFVGGGLMAVLLSLFALFFFRPWEGWLEVALGAGLALSPWVVGFGGLQQAIWNAVAAGIVIGAMGLWSTLAARRGPTA